MNHVEMDCWRCGKITGEDVVVGYGGGSGGGVGRERGGYEALVLDLPGDSIGDGREEKRGEGEQGWRRHERDSERRCEVGSTEWSIWVITRSRRSRSDFAGSSFG